MRRRCKRILHSPRVHPPAGSATCPRPRRDPAFCLALLSPSQLLCRSAEAPSRRRQAAPHAAPPHRHAGQTRRLERGRRCSERRLLDACHASLDVRHWLHAHRATDPTRAGAHSIIAMGNHDVLLHRPRRHRLPCGGLCVRCGEAHLEPPAGTLPPASCAVTCTRSLVRFCAQCWPRAVRANYLDVTRTHVGLVSGVGNCLSSVAAMAAPFIVGALVSRAGSWDPVWYCISGGCVASTAVFCALSSTTPVEQQLQKRGAADAQQKKVQ